MASDDPEYDSQKRMVMMLPAELVRHLDVVAMRDPALAARSVTQRRDDLVTLAVELFLDGEFGGPVRLPSR